VDDGYTRPLQNHIKAGPTSGCARTNMSVTRREYVNGFIQHQSRGHEFKIALDLQHYLNLLDILI
jgi:hypothetical protein